MKNYLLLFVFCCGCVSQKETVVPKFESKICATEKMSCRAIFVDEDKVWLGLDKGRFGFYDKIKDTLILKTSQFVSNTTEFRSIAATKKAIFILAVGNPAVLIKIDKKTLAETIVYKEENEKFFMIVCNS